MLQTYANFSQIKIHARLQLTIMSGVSIKELKGEFGFTQTEFAQRLGLTLRTIQNYEKGTDIPVSIQKLIQHEFFSQSKASEPVSIYGGKNEIADKISNRVGRDLVKGDQVKGGPFGEIDKLRYENESLKKLVKEKQIAGWKGMFEEVKELLQMYKDSKKGD